MIRFAIVSILILGSCTLIIIDTKSVYLGVLLVAMLVMIWDQAKRLRAMSELLRILWTEREQRRIRERQGAPRGH